MTVLRQLFYLYSMLESSCDVFEFNLERKQREILKKYSFYQFLWFVSLSALHLGRSFTFLMNHIVRLLFLALLNFIGRTHGLLPLVCEGLFVLKFFTLIPVCPFDQLRVSIKPS